MASTQDITVDIVDIVDIVDAGMTGGSRRCSLGTLGTMSAPVLAAVLVAGLSSCGAGGNEEAAAHAAAALDAPTDTWVSLIVTVPIVTTPIVTTVPVDTNIPSAGPSTVVPTAVSNELTAFADSHGDLIDEWSDQLAAFGLEAPSHLANVSEAPTAAATLDLSEQMIAAIGSETSDPDLVTLRSFATDMSAAITASLDGEQDAAINRFLGLQIQSESLTAVLAQIDG